MPIPRYDCSFVSSDPARNTSKVLADCLSPCLSPLRAWRTAGGSVPGLSSKKRPRLWVRGRQEYLPWHVKQTPVSDHRTHPPTIRQMARYQRRMPGNWLKGSPGLSQVRAWSQSPHASSANMRTTGTSRAWRNSARRSHRRSLSLAVSRRRACRRSRPTRQPQSESATWSAVRPPARLLRRPTPPRPSPAAAPSSPARSACPA
jgi:hypothetical protein